MAELDRKWKGIEEVNKPNLVMVVCHLKGYLLALVSLKKYKGLWFGLGSGLGLF